MGCDGGTIPRRDELVRVKKKPEQKDKEAELAYRWRHCSIRQLPLQAPIVACGLGRLYSKEAVLEGLLDRSVLSESAAHIKNLKDIKNLNLTPNPAYDGDTAKNGGYINDGMSPYICPVIGLEMNGKYKFCFLWSCGCVMSERALKEIKTYTCHKCQKPFADTDIVVMNAQDEDLKTMEENMILRKAERKSKKRTKEQSTDNDKIKEEKEIIEEKDKEVKEEIPNKKIKKEKHKAQTSKNVTKNDPQDPAYKKAKEDYSVAQDPNASEVLKSIFTTHKTAAQQTRAHWVTYNPFYN
ncbi:replication termination factor 2 [Nasonia vitripennis]|uniref:Replication termination factor 2 n=1 Tax=Nasonia vitripennis TaxID=7425 RepID=A0A7M7QWX3_NASVI|nr:replication termination factor 2 [Nasonia vitripennis]XP_032455793.1 replication termination factor 2 [Nasonia vitripennis]